jgi:hypothetical protein
MSIQRALPAFGRELAESLSKPATWRKYIGTSADGKSPTIWVLCGPNGWEIARVWNKRRLIVMVPDGDDPYRFDWRMLARYVPAVITPCGNVERAELHRLADAILRDGSSKVIALTGNGIVRYLRADAKVAA